MASTTGIEWTDATWNPIRGCSRVSEGCRHCYAEGVAYRFSGPGQPYEGLVRIGANGERRREWNGQVRFVEEHLLDPLKWKSVLTGIARGEGVLREKAHRDGTVTAWRERPRRIFVNSMSDLFHENVTDEMRDRIFAVMALCPQHTFQVLTKRPERMLTYVATRVADDGLGIRRTHADRITMIVGNQFPLGLEAKLQPIVWPLPNVWLGVSVEDQATADARIPLLLQTPAAVRFVSAEPLLGPIDLRKTEWLKAIAPRGWQGERRYPFPSLPESSRTYFVDLLDWVIVGGESGPGARPMHPDWARRLRDQCVAAGVPFFFKQWGEWIPHEMCSWEQSEGCDNGEFHRQSSSIGAEFVLGCLCSEGDPYGNMRRVGKRAAGHLLDGKEWHQFPEVRA